MRRKAFSTLAACVAVLLAFGMLSSVARAEHEEGAGPDQTQKTIVYTSPGVVFVVTDLQIKARLTYADASTISGRRALSKTFNIPYGTGSGFVVNPDGVVVTASHVVEPERQTILNFVGNKMVLETFGYTYDDAYGRFFIDDSNVLNQLLKQCYKGIACKVQINPQISVYSGVDVAGSTLPDGKPGRVLTSTGFGNTDVAVIQVQGENVPTVSLADTAGVESGDEVTALGYPGSAQNLPSGVTEPTKIFGRVSNIRETGTTEVVEVDMDIEPGMSGGPVINDEGQVVGLSSFLLLQSSGESGSSYLATVDNINSALSDAGVSAERGEVDKNFELAMQYYWGSHFSDSIPLYNKVLAVHDGHPLAKKFHAEAQTKSGSASDLPLEEPGGFPVWIIAAIAGVVVVGGLAFFMMSRKKSPAPAMAGMAPVQAAPTPEPATEETRAVGFQAAPSTGVGGVAPAAAQSTTEAPAASAAPAAAPAATPTTGASEPAAEVPHDEAPAPTKRFCGQCGTDVGATNKFCQNCGAAVS